tara:strand:+ start:67 stop:201 length:135 start_codon:yes stop_codon:yes gene_type:complete
MKFFALATIASTASAQIYTDYAMGCRNDDQCQSASSCCEASKTG